MLGSRHVMVVHADDGMDEISVCSPTFVAELKDGEIKTRVIEPAQFSMQLANIEDIRVDGPAQSLSVINSILSGEAGAAQDIVCLNAGATIYVAGLSDSHEGGVEIARQVIASGAAATTLQKLVELSNE